MDDITEYASPVPPDQVACFILGGKGVTKRECQEQCRVIPRNEMICKRGQCPSPWRLCVICVSQGYTADSAIVKKGKDFCSFHILDMKAVRERDTPKALPPMREQWKQKREIGKLVEYIMRLEQNISQ